MKQAALMITIMMLSLALPPIHAQPDITPQSLTLTLYTNGAAKIDYYVTGDPSKIRVKTELFGSTFSNLVIRDEEGNPLDADLNQSLVTVDSIGALELNFSYFTYDLTTLDEAIWKVNITSPAKLTIILPKGSQFLDMSEVPTDIGYIGESLYLEFKPGYQFVYYLLGLPTMSNEAERALTQVQNYLDQKNSEGYVLTGAYEVLAEAQRYYETDQFYEAKKTADDALLLSTQIVELADRSKLDLESAEKAISLAESEKRTVGLSDAKTLITEATSLYHDGSYRKSRTLAIQASEEAELAEKPHDNSMIYLICSIFVLMSLLFYCFYKWYN